MLRTTLITFALAALAAHAQPGQPAPAQPSLSMQDSNLKLTVPGALQGVGIDQKLDQQIPLDLTFHDEYGHTVPLSTYFQGNKPVIIAPVYYRCPMLCTQILNGLESSLKVVTFEPRQGFRSRDPQLRPEGHAGDRRRQEGRPTCGAITAPAPPTAGTS